MIAGSFALSQFHTTYFANTQKYVNNAGDGGGDLVLQLHFTSELGKTTGNLLYHLALLPLVF
jgi:hypothetical protein